MAVRSVLASVSLIAFAITSQSAFAANDDNSPAANPSTTNPSAAPAKRPHRHHAHRHHPQQQTPSPQIGGAPPSNG